MAKNLTEKPSKGKYFLVNDTFVRVDGADWVNIQANIGRFRSIEVVTANASALIHRPLCDGYVVTPEHVFVTKPHVNKRCMTEAELAEAREDHYFMRPNLYLHKQLWLEYWHSRDKFGQTHADENIQAYNRALHEKRQQFARDNPHLNSEQIIKMTFNEEEAAKNFKPRDLD